MFNLSDTNAQYVLLGSVAISIGLGIFLYREFRKMKTEISELNQTLTDLDNDEQLATNTKAIENVEEQLLQIKQLLQGMTMQRQRSPLQPVPTQPAQRVEITERPNDVEQIPEEVVIDNEECEDGVCPLPTTPVKREPKVLTI
jgi:hypothetical protein